MDLRNGAAFGDKLGGATCNRNGVQVHESFINSREVDGMALGGKGEFLNREIRRFKQCPLTACRLIVQIEVPAIRFEAGSPLRFDRQQFSVWRERRLLIGSWI